MILWITVAVVDVVSGLSAGSIVHVKDYIKAILLVLVLEELPELSSEVGTVDPDECILRQILLCTISLFHSCHISDAREFAGTVYFTVNSSFMKTRGLESAFLFSRRTATVPSGLTNI